VGRDESEIERTANIGPIIIRDTVEEAQRALVDIFQHNGGAKMWAGRSPADQPVGPPEVVAEALAPYLGIGYRHLVVGLPSPYDEETMARLAQEVRPLLG